MENISRHVIIPGVDLATVAEHDCEHDDLNSERGPLHSLSKEKKTWLKKFKSTVNIRFFFESNMIT